MGYEIVDRLSIIITNKDAEQSLYIPTLDSDTGKTQAKAIFDDLCGWGLEKIVKHIVLTLLR